MKRWRRSMSSLLLVASSTAATATRCIRRTWCSKRWPSGASTSTRRTSTQRLE